MRLVRDRLYVFPIGGVGNMGDNCLVYCYNDVCVIVDYGLGLSKVDDVTEYDAFCLDLELFLPLVCKNGVIHLFITHCHDDHVSAIKHLLEAAEKLSYTINIYVSTVFNKNLILYKASDVVSDQIQVVGFGNVVCLGELLCIFHEVDHSIPESAAVLITTKPSDGSAPLRLLHTGDWNIYDGAIVTNVDLNADHDFKNYLGSSKTLRMFGWIGYCDIIVSETTSILVASKKYSDAAIVHESLTNLLNTLLAEGKMIYFTCFSSCVDRALWLARYAKENGVSMACTGRAFSDVFAAVRESEYGDYKCLSYVTMCSSIDAIHRDNYRIKLITGCQNEPGSALNKLLGMKLPLEHCAVIMSSSRIPPLIKRISQAYNELIIKGADVYCSGVYPDMHCSGHAPRDLILFMYKCLKPSYIVPVHGNFINLQYHSMLGSRISTICKKQVKISWGHNKYFVYYRDKTGTVVGHEHVLDVTFIRKIYTLDGFTFNANHPVLRARKKLIAGGLICIHQRRKSLFCIGTRISNNAKSRILKFIDTNTDKVVIKNYIEKKLLLKGEVLII